MNVGVDEPGESESAVSGDAVNERLHRRSTAVQAYQSLHQQLGTLDVRYQGDRMLNGDPPSDVTLGDEGRVPSNTH